MAIVAFDANTPRRLLGRHGHEALMAIVALVATTTREVYIGRGVGATPHFLFVATTATTGRSASTDQHARRSKKSQFRFSHHGYDSYKATSATICSRQGSVVATMANVATSATFTEPRGGHLATIATLP